MCSLLTGSAENVHCFSSFALKMKGFVSLIGDCYRKTKESLDHWYRKRKFLRHFDLRMSYRSRRKTDDTSDFVKKDRITANACHLVLSRRKLFFTTF